MRQNRRSNEPSGWSGGAIVFAMPIIAFAVTVLVLGRGDGLDRGTPPLPPVENALDVQGLTGVLVGQNGARVEVRLLPLHADAGRQDYDALRLRQRYGELGPGEPWRLVVLYHDDPQRQDAEEPVLDLSHLAVVDVSGAQLVDFPEPALDDDGLRDPLAALLSRSPSSLKAGQEAQRILWGAAPGAGARVIGLVERREDVADLPLFAPSNAETEVALGSAALRQVRELSLFQAQIALADGAEEDL